MKRGVRGLVSKLAQPVHELFLELVCQVVLGSKEDDGALGDCTEVSRDVSRQRNSQRTSNC